MKKGLLVAILAAALASQMGAKQNSKTELNYASTKDIRDINPHLYGGEMAAQNLVFESLVLNKNGQIQPNLATKWQISPDGKTYRFSLRDDVYYTDGSKFNAKSVVQNFDAVMANRARHAWLELINAIDSYEANGEYEFVLRLKNPYYPTLTELAMTRPLRFVSPNCFKNGGSKDGLSCLAGTGAYKLAKHERNSFAIFELNEKYWGQKPKLKSIKWLVMPDSQSILLGLIKGDVDLIFGADGDTLGADAFSMLKSQANLKTAISNPVASRAIVLNSNQGPTKDARLRLALNYAIDKNAIAKGVLNGNESVADTLFSKSTPYCDISLKTKSYDPAKAASILDEAGWVLKNGLRQKDGEVLNLKLYYNSKNANEKAISEYIQANLKAIGVGLSIIGEEKQAFLNRQKTGEFDMMYSLSWGLPYDPQSYISSWRQPAHADYQAQIGLSKKQWLDEQIKAVLSELNEGKRAKMYVEILSYINDSDVYIPLSYSRTKAAFRADLQGVGFNISQYEIPFENMYFND